jgi:3-hydroxyisobutyrate dehydrogenase-like beta-hydroxyacid dehydrogenase
MLPSIAFLGIGLMGAPMSRRLLAAGFPLTAWNRSAAKAAALVPDGARVADDAAQAAAGADIVITMLQDGGAVQSVLTEGGVAAAMRPGSLFIDMSSVLPDEARGFAQRLSASEVEALDAPVSGGTVGAEAGTLAIMAGGTPAAFARAAPVFAALGRATHVGPTGSGQLAKLANQMIVGITIGAVAEALLLAEQGGADPAQVLTALRGGFAQSRVLELHGDRMARRDFAKRAAMTVQLKDLRNALTTGAAQGADLPVTALLSQLYAEAIVHGDADLDHSALWRELARRNHLLGP